MDKSAPQQNTDLSQINTTGVRIIILFSLLLDSPKSAEEINESFLKHPLIRTQFSDDTIRNDINTLRNSGCRISRALKTNFNRYVLLEHPFELDLKPAYVDSFKKFYKKIYDKLNCDELVQFEYLFEKLAVYTKNPLIKEKLVNISAIKNIDKKILQELLHHAYNKHEITLLYRSSNGNQKEIELVADEIAFRNDKLYIFAYDIAHKKNAFYLVKNIIDILHVKLLPTASVAEPLKVTYKLLNTRQHDYILAENENLIEEFEDSLIIEASFPNEFIMTQNLLRFGRNCVVLEPLWFKTKFIEQIKAIREVYNVY